MNFYSLLGLPYQLDTLKRLNLKATYFVEPLFSYAFGREALRKVWFPWWRRRGRKSAFIFTRSG